MNWLLVAEGELLCGGVDCINKAGATTLARCPDKPDHKGGDKSLARLWWDEIFTTCIGRMMIHSHRNMHPGEFRSFSAREYARAQGFPDWYKICGSASKYCNKKCVSTLSQLSVELDAFEPDATLLRMAGGLCAGTTTRRRWCR